MTQEPLRLLVVDDASLYRKVLTNVLSAMEGIEVIGSAENGKIALEKVSRFHPDMLTLDVEMPVMDGLETLRQLPSIAPHVAVVMVSSHTNYGARTTLEALDLGAIDFIMKPTDLKGTHCVEYLRRQLQPIIQAVKARKQIRVLIANPLSAPLRSGPSLNPMRPSVPSLPPVARNAIDIVALGVSTGGPHALAHMLSALPAELAAPIVIVQHMPPLFTSELATSLDQKCALHVVEGCSGQGLEAGTVYLAPGGKQMKVVQQSPLQRPSILITDSPPENHCKPSVDYLLRSVAQLYANRALGVIMTGMGSDGVEGLRLMKQRGAYIIAQDAASCVVFGMPMEAIKAGIVDAVVPLDQLADTIQRHVGRRT